MAGFWELPTTADLPGLSQIREHGAFRHTIVHTVFEVHVCTGILKRAPRGMVWTDELRGEGAIVSTVDDMLLFAPDEAGLWRESGLLNAHLDNVRAAIAAFEEYLRRDSIKLLSMQLAEVGFIRIARSLLVNSAAVLYAEVAGHGTFAFTLTSGVCLHSSAAYRDSILRIIPLAASSKRCGGTAF